MPFTPFPVLCHGWKHGTSAFAVRCAQVSLTRIPPSPFSGAQFVLSVRIYEAQKKCVPPSKRSNALSYAAMQWALQSDSQDGFLPLVIAQSVSCLHRPKSKSSRRSFAEQSYVAALPPCLYACMLVCLYACMLVCLYAGVLVCLQPSWASLRELGVPLWLKNDEELRKIVERCAKTQVRGLSHTGLSNLWWCLCLL
jgi:hypothetical protein